MSLMGYEEQDVEAMANAVAVAIDTISFAMGEDELENNLRRTLDFLEGLLEEGRV